MEYPPRMYERYVGFPNDDARFIFVYGTVKTGFPNHYVAEHMCGMYHGLKMGSYTTFSPFPLVVGPHGTPYMIHLPGSGHRVKGELYMFTGVGRICLRNLEEGHYEMRQVTIFAMAEDGARWLVDAEAYFAHKDFGKALWERCGERGYSEYTAEMGSKYVKKYDRARGFDVVKDLQAFISESTTTNSP